MAKLKDRLSALETRDKASLGDPERAALVTRFTYVSAVLSSFIPSDRTNAGLLPVAEAERNMIAAGVSEVEAKRYAAMGYNGARAELMPVTKTGAQARELARVRQEKAIEAVREPRIHQVREPGTWFEWAPGKH